MTDTEIVAAIRASLVTLGDISDVENDTLFETIWEIAGLVGYNLDGDDDEEKA